MYFYIKIINIIKTIKCIYSNALYNNNLQIKKRISKKTIQNTNRKNATNYFNKRLPKCNGTGFNARL